jgi:menaquinone-specific isochorismate synthase
VKKQSSIEINRFTNFLRQGAFVRRQGVWTLLFDVIEGPEISTVRSIKTDFLTSESSRKCYKNQWDMNFQEFDRVLAQVLESASQHQEKIIIEWKPVDKSVFVKAYELGQKAIAAGEVKKFVPIACQTGRLSKNVSVWQKLNILKSLSRTPLAMYPYGEWDDQSGFAGASPEVFFELEQLNLKTMALAGTSGKDVDISQFRSDPKECREHQFVIDDISEQLAAVSTITVGATEVVQFPVLNHLKTEITAKLFKIVSVDDLIKRLHPTSALGIYPRNEFFKSFVRFPLQSERGFFGAPWGFETATQTFLLVAIRKWDWSDRNVKIYAGCGVVQESVLEKEFAEILKKIDSVKTIFFQEEV